MNARIAVLENQRLVNELVLSAKTFAKRRSVSIVEALDFQVQSRIKYASTESAKAAWEQRGDVALKMIEE
jgi:hypothetical protein